MKKQWTALSLILSATSLLSVSAHAKCEIWINSSVRTQSFAQFDEREIQNQLAAELNKKGYQVVERGEEFRFNYEIQGVGTRNGYVSMTALLSRTDGGLRMQLSNYQSVGKREKKQLKILDKVVERTLSAVPKCRKVD